MTTTANAAATRTGRVPPYPVSAVVGADDLKLALILNAVHPPIGGVLVRGEKGTAKSTAVRGLAALLPDVTVVAGCRFACDPASPEPDCPDGPHTVMAGADAGHLLGGPSPALRPAIRPLIQEPTTMPPTSGTNSTQKSRSPRPRRSTTTMGADRT